MTTPREANIWTHAEVEALQRAWSIHNIPEAFGECYRVTPLCKNANKAKIVYRVFSLLLNSELDWMQVAGCIHAHRSTAHQRWAKPTNN
jgi:hypothetical protein